MSQRRTTNARGRNGQQAEILERTFGDLGVRDARRDLRVPIKAIDVRKGEPRNPEKCALAQACIREFDSSAAVIYVTRAYVDVLDEDGVRWVERFVLSPASRAIVELFDREDRDAIPKDGRLLVLSAPKPGESLDADCERQRKRREAIRRGEYTPVAGRGQQNRSKGRDLPLRSGTGHWQMIQRREGSEAA